MFICLHFWLHVHMCNLVMFGAIRFQKKSDPLELEFQKAVNWRMVLGTEQHPLQEEQVSLTLLLAPHLFNPK